MQASGESGSGERRTLLNVPGRKCCNKSESVYANPPSAPVVLKDEKNSKSFAPTEKKIGNRLVICFECNLNLYVWLPIH